MYHNKKERLPYADNGVLLGSTQECDFIPKWICGCVTSHPRSVIKLRIRDMLWSSVLFSCCLSRSQLRKEERRGEEREGRRGEERRRGRKRRGKKREEK